MDAIFTKLVEFLKNKKFFKRLVLLLCLITCMIILILNVECGYSKKEGFYFKFTPAAEITKEVKL